MERDSEGIGGDDVTYLVVGVVAEGAAVRTGTRAEASRVEAGTRGWGQAEPRVWIVDCFACAARGDWGRVWMWA